MNQPAPPDLKSGAVQDRPKGGGRRVRVVLGKLKRRGRNANLAVFAVLVAEADEDLLGAFGLAEVNSHLRHVSPSSASVPGSNWPAVQRREGYRPNVVDPGDTQFLPSLLLVCALVRHAGLS